MLGRFLAMMGTQARAQIAVVLRAARQEAREFAERHLVDATVELDDDGQWDPTVVPTPGAQFGVGGRRQAPAPCAAADAGPGKGVRGAEANVFVIAIA